MSNIATPILSYTKVSNWAGEREGSNCSWHLRVLYHVECVPQKEKSVTTKGKNYHQIFFLFHFLGNMTVKMMPQFRLEREKGREREKGILSNPSCMFHTTKLKNEMHESVMNLIIDDGIGTGNWHTIGNPKPRLKSKPYLYQA